MKPPDEIEKPRPRDSASAGQEEQGQHRANAPERQEGQDDALTPIVVDDCPAAWAWANNRLSDLCHRNTTARYYFDLLRLKTPGLTDERREYNKDADDLRRAYARFKRAADDIDKSEKRLLARVGRGRP